MKWWRMSEKARTRWSAIILIAIILAVLAGLIALVCWLMPTLANAFIRIFAIAIVLVIFAGALNFR